MDENFEIKGTWWLPSNPTRKISGILKFIRKDGISLELHEAFASASSPSDFMVMEIIHGKSYEGKAVTLYNCFETTKGPPAIIVANNLFIGKLFDCPEAIKFSSVRVNYEHLEEWLGGARFDREIKPPFWIKHTPPKDFNIELPSIDASLRLDYRCSSQGDLIRAAQLQHTDYLELCPKVPQSYLWYTDKLYALHLFIIIMAGGVVDTNSVFGYGDVVNQVRDEEVREEIEIHRVPSDIYSKKIDPWNIIFRLPQLGEHSQNYMDKWFQDVGLLSPVFDLLWPIMSRHSKYHEVIFLNLTQAIEAFHRRSRNSMYLTEQNYKVVYDALHKAIPPNIPQGLRDSLISKLKYGNEISLRNRLKELLSGPIWDNCLNCFIKNRGKFIAVVVDTRNYLVHYDQSLEESALTASVLSHFNELLRLVLFVLLYHHIGIPTELISNAIRDKGPFKYYLLEKRPIYFGTRLDNFKF